MDVRNMFIGIVYTKVWCYIIYL